MALVRDLREHRAPASAEEVAGFETDVLAGFVLGLDRILDGVGALIEPGAYPPGGSRACRIWPESQPVKSASGQPRPATRAS